jgi:hypothetical protein
MDLAGAETLNINVTVDSIIAVVETLYIRFNGSMIGTLHCGGAH